jgi:hypothetical protein
LGGEGDGDVESEGLELAEVGGDLPVAVGRVLAPVGPRSVNLAAGSASRCQWDDDDEDGAGDVVPQTQRHKRKYNRRQHETPMALWHLDHVGGIYLADGRGCKMLSGIDGTRGS